MRRTRRRRLELEPLEARLVLNAPTPYPGTPFVVPQDGDWTQTPFVGSPIFADLNGDGKDELIVAIAGGRLQAYSSRPDGYDVFMTYETGSVANFKATPIVVSMPDGSQAIFAALGRDEGDPGTVEDGRLFAFDAVSGQVLPGWPVDTGQGPIRNPATGLQESGVVGPLTSGDLTGDGVPEIVVSNVGSFVSAYRIDGSLLWRYGAPDAVLSGAVIGDVDRDGRMEVVVGSDSTASPYYPDGGWIHILNHHGAVKYSHPVGEGVWSAPALADLTGDGFLEIVVGTGLYHAVNWPSDAVREAGNQLIAIDYQGRMLPGWPYRTTFDNSLNRQTYASTAVADMDGNGFPEVITVDQGGFVHVVRGNGQPFPGFEGGRSLLPPGIDPNTVGAYGSPIVADVNGDGGPDIIAAVSAFVTALDAQGETLFRLGPFGSETRFNTPAIGQFDGVGGLELAAISNVAAVPNRPYLVSIHTLPESELTPPWPLQRRTATGQAVAYSKLGTQMYVIAAYRSLLGREPIFSELNAATRLIESNFITPWTFAQFLGFHPEADPNLDLDQVIAEYRVAFPGAHVFEDSLAAIRLDRAAGVPEPVIRANLVASGLNYAATNHWAGYVRSVYRDLLRREPGPVETAYWLDLFHTGGLTPDVFVWSILESPEGRTLYIQDQYARLLGRAPSPTELATIIGYSQREDVLLFIVVSEEYYARSGGSDPAYVHAFFRDLVNVDPVPADVQNSYVQRLQGNTGRRRGPQQPAAVRRFNVVNELVRSQFFYENRVIEQLFRYVPDEAKGVLRFGTLGPGSPTINPDPALIEGLVQARVLGTTDSQILTFLLTSPMYQAKTAYFRGYYRSSGIRF